jgi:hypothetical protein
MGVCGDFAESPEAVSLLDVKLQAPESMTERVCGCCWMVVGSCSRLSA